MREQIREREGERANTYGISDRAGDAEAVGVCGSWTMVTLPTPRKMISGAWEWAAVSGADLIGSQTHPARSHLHGCVCVCVRVRACDCVRRACVFPATGRSRYGNAEREQVCERGYAYPLQPLVRVLAAPLARSSRRQTIAGLCSV